MILYMKKPALFLVLLQFLTFVSGCVRQNETRAADLSLAAEKVSVSSDVPLDPEVKDIPFSDSAAASILYCPDSKERLYGHDINDRRAIASTTKIMTALLGSEAAAEDDIVVEVTKEMYAEGSSLCLREGEKLKLSEIVRGMMAVSGNDAANAVALTCGGSIEGFADMMNQRAAELGMKNTHFVTPSGLDAPEHYSTAYDMALLGAAAMENDAFRSVVSSPSAEVHYAEPEGKTQTLRNSNRLLSDYDGCIGIKTGFTDEAGRTLVSCAERNGVRLIAVTLCDRDDWRDHKAMLDHGFSQLSRVSLWNCDREISLAVAGTADDVSLIPRDEITAVIKNDDKNKIKEKIFAPRFLYSPVAPGTVAGSVEYRIGDRIIAAGELITA